MAKIIVRKGNRQSRLKTISIILNVLFICFLFIESYYLFSDNLSNTNQTNGNDISKLFELNYNNYDSLFASFEVKTNKLTRNEKELAYLALSYFILNREADDPHIYWWIRDTNKLNGQNCQFDKLALNKLESILSEKFKSTNPLLKLVKTKIYSLDYNSISKAQDSVESLLKLYPNLEDGKILLSTIYFNLYSKDNNPFYKNKKDSLLNEVKILRKSYCNYISRQ